MANTGAMYSTSGAIAAIPAGAGAMNSTTVAGAAVTAGTGAMCYTAGADLAIITRAGAMYSFTSTGAANAAGAGRCDPPLEQRGTLLPLPHLAERGTTTIGAFKRLAQKQNKNLLFRA